MKRELLGLFLVGAVLMGCGAAREQASTAHTDKNEAIDTTQVCSHSLFITRPGEDGPTPAGADNGVYIKSLAQRDSCLEVVVEFSGCPSDELVFTWNSALMKSYPPKMNIAPAFVSKGDCEMIRQEVFLLNFRSLLRKHGRVDVLIANTEKSILME